MPLLPPQVIGPISPCNRAVLSQGQIPGFDIRIFAGDRLVAEAPATAVEQVVPLSAAGEFAPGDLVRAQQIDPATGETSVDHPDGVEVMITPDRRALGAPAWLGRLHECGRCIMVGGCYPGARVWITDASGSTLAESEVVRTVARFHLNRPVRNASEILTAHQEACGVSGADAASPTPASFMNETLPPPEVREPLYQCMRRVYVSGVYEGASVLLGRTIGADLSGCFDAPELYFGLPPDDDLKEGEAITAQQGYPDCDIQSLPSDPKTVRPAESVPAPRIANPPCAGSDRVVIENLVPDAIVHIEIDGVEVGRAAAAAPTDVFLVPPLVFPASGVATLTASQVLCGFSSPESDGVPIVSDSGGPEALRLGMLYACVTTVQVTGTTPGARIELRSDVRGVLARATATSNVTLLNVPALRPGETIIATQHTCGAESARTMVRVFEWLQPLPRPMIVGPILAGDRIVVVDDAMQGALIEVWVDDALWQTDVGVRDLDTRRTTVTLDRPLEKDAVVRVAQRLCSNESERSSTSVVQGCTGRIRVGLKSLLAEDGEDHMPRLVAQANWARRLFRNRGIDLLVVDRQTLDLPRFRSFSHRDRDLIRELAGVRDHLGDGDIPCYLVPDGDSGGAELSGTDAAIIWRDSDIHTLAHELIHVFGVSEHAPPDQTWRLMHPGGFPPATPSPTVMRALADHELETVRGHSRFFHPCS